MLSFGSRKGFFKPESRRKPHRKRTRRVLGNPYLIRVLALRKTLPDWDNLFGAPEELRIPQLIRLNVVGEYLVNKYSWAIPDTRAIRILSAFAPLIEIGCGLGYWGRLLHDSGVDIISVDRLGPRRDSWTYVVKGGPLLLQKPFLQGRNLFLCYPDEDGNLGSLCLQHFSGEYIIHVGELLITGTQCGFPQRPWGRTTSADFQVKLYENFHCIVAAALPSYPVGKDYITVWKRTYFVAGKSYEHDKDDTWVSIPPSERMNYEAAAPSCRHMLSSVNS